mmetsp:Transcript_4445/g.10866  ORF Transcript_4445/g.10866 Transcript_4445/m.10866 type:complete len:183 (-) Transcript_4445:318-866(-)
MPHFLGTHEALAVTAGCGKLRKKLKGDHSIAAGRLSAMVPFNNDAYKTFAGEAVVGRLRALVGGDFLACGDYPVEVRLYRPGSHMPWHQDVKLYEQPQYELIYTVSNSSDATTEWRGSDGVHYSITPPGDSLLLFRADAAWHRVVGSTVGERVIIKALYATAADFAKTDAFAEIMASAPWRR